MTYNAQATGAVVRGGIPSGLADDGKSSVPIGATGDGALRVADVDMRDMFQGQLLQLLRGILAETRLTRQLLCAVTGQMYVQANIGNESQEV